MPRVGYYEVLPCMLLIGWRNHALMMDLPWPAEQVLKRLGWKKMRHRQSGRDIVSTGIDRSCPRCNRKLRRGGERPARVVRGRAASLRVCPGKNEKDVPGIRWTDRDRR